MKRKILDLAIVTSCHNYGQYLREWAQSIVDQEDYIPAICVIVDNGSTDASPRQVIAASKIIEAAGIKCRVQRIPYVDFGSARNRAVELSGETEWVMHFDADDTLMPHALKTIAEIMPNADVVGLGYQRSGDLAAGPRNRTRLYSSHQGTQTLKSKAPCSGVSPFRRRFWKESPYRTDMRGGWDTALWIGFAHMNARFVATRVPVFYYRQHADSVFNVRRLNEWKGKLVGTKLRNLRAKISDGVSVVVPIMRDGAERDASWKWIKEQYEKNHPDFEIVEGHLPPGTRWNKGRAVANALEKASHHTLIIADSDCFVEPDGLNRAVKALADEETGWVIPHRLVHRLDRDSSKAFMNRSMGIPSYQRDPYEGYAGGGMLVVDRSEYEAVGGIPQAFEGWGAEDECLAVILDVLVGRRTRFDHDLWHLYHPTARKANVNNNRNNRQILRVFLGLQTDPMAMWQLTQHVARGEDPRTFSYGGASGNNILMKAVLTHQRGRDVVKAGEYFRATPQEARRYKSQPRKLAYPVNGNVLDTAVNLRHGR